MPEAQQLYLCVLIAGRSHFLSLGISALYSLEVLELEFGVDNLLIADRVDSTVHVSDVLVVEAAKHVDDSVSLADVAEELITQPLTLARTLHQTSDVNNITYCRDNASWVNYFCEFCQTVIWYADLPHLSIDCTKREVSCLCFS